MRDLPKHLNNSNGLIGRTLIPVAKVLRSFGTDGKVILQYNLPCPEDENLDKRRPVFIFFDGLPVPFFIEDVNTKGSQQLLIKFEGIDTQKFAEEIVGETVYIERKQKKGSQEKVDKNTCDDITEMIGFEVFDSHEQYIGIIQNIYPYPNNLCIGVHREDKEEELLIPFNEELIVSISITGKKTVLNLPDGILDL
jgi:16S rRNA processing protein RimM